MTIGERIRQLREERGWSLTRLGASVGSRSYLYRIEGGDSSPTLNWIERAADAFGISVLDIIGPVYQDWNHEDALWDEVNQALDTLKDSERKLAITLGAIASREMARHRLAKEESA